MRYMIIVRATAETESELPAPMLDEQLMAAMAGYHEELAQAGVLLDAAGLQPSSKGWRIRYSGDQRTVVDGPCAEAKELIAGYTLVQVRSREEALQWSRRFPNPIGAGRDAEIEVRRLYEMDDFAQIESAGRLRKPGVA